MSREEGNYTVGGRSEGRYSLGDGGGFYIPDTGDDQLYRSGPTNIQFFDPRTAYVHSSMKWFEDGRRVDIPKMVRWLPKGQTIVAFVLNGEYAEVLGSGTGEEEVRLSAPLASALSSDAEVSTGLSYSGDRRTVRVEIRRPE